MILKNVMMYKSILKSLSQTWGKKKYIDLNIFNLWMYKRGKKSGEQTFRQDQPMTRPIKKSKIFIKVFTIRSV